MFTAEQERRRADHVHPYLAGNFAPIHQELPLTQCTYTGTIPQELAGGEYVRNGGNPVTNEDLGRDAHWFDGDGMLSGVSFTRIGKKQDQIQPEFVNQYVLTDVYISTKTSPFLMTPILPSIATLVNPLSSLLTIVLRVFRTILLVVLSNLPGSEQAIRRISVANTSILYHDGRALATCESGPPIRVALPGLETVGWFNGKKVEGEYSGEDGPGFGGTGPLSFMKEWTTAHPRVDPITSEFILFHSTFAPPYVHYSIVPAAQRPDRKALETQSPRLLTAPVKGISSPKMMHDFGVSRLHTIIMDLPLSLDPLNLAKNRPVVAYDPAAPSRFGVFPRYEPSNVRWFETNACCIFHTANSWDTVERDSVSGQHRTTAVNMLGCRLTSASLVFSAGNLASPVPLKSIPEHLYEEEKCQLYYYQFPMGNHNSESESTSTTSGSISHQWALSAIPFEFPTLRDSACMSQARYIYGCSMSGGSFGAALGRAVKINSIVKIDATKLIERGLQRPPVQIKGCVDMRNVDEVLSSEDPDDPIKLFRMPPGWFVQEPRFVPRENSVVEDDGWLLTYVFDESQLDSSGECKPDAKSELWIIDAKNMKEVVARIQLPQRVPYGLHGTWFSEQQIRSQRPIERVRRLPTKKETNTDASMASTSWLWFRRRVEAFLA